MRNSVLPSIVRIQKTVLMAGPKKQPSRTKQKASMWPSTQRNAKVILSSGLGLFANSKESQCLPWIPWWGMWNKCKKRTIQTSFSSTFSRDTQTVYWRRLTPLSKCHSSCPTVTTVSSSRWDKRAIKDSTLCARSTTKDTQSLTSLLEWYSSNTQWSRNSEMNCCSRTLPTLAWAATFPRPWWIWSLGLWWLKHTLTSRTIFIKDVGM